MTSKRGYTVITSKIGYLPLRPEIVDDPQYLAAWAKEHPMVRPNLKQLAVLEPWDPMPGANYRQIGKMMMDAVEQAVRGQGDVRQTLKAAQELATLCAAAIAAVTPAGPAPQTMTSQSAVSGVSRCASVSMPGLDVAAAALVIAPRAPKPSSEEARKRRREDAGESMR